MIDSRGFLVFNFASLFREGSIVLGAQLAYNCTGLPHLAVAQGSQLLLKTLTVAGL